MYDESKHAMLPAQIVTLRELPVDNPGGMRLLNGGLSIVAGVKVKVDVWVGEAEMTIQQLFDLKADSVVVLDQLCDAPVSVRLDGQTIATGTLVVVGDHFGVKVTDILPAPATVE